MHQFSIFMLLIVQILGYCQTNRVMEIEGFTVAQREFTCTIRERCHTVQCITAVLLFPVQSSDQSMSIISVMLSQSKRWLLKVCAFTCVFCLCTVQQSLWVAFISPASTFIVRFSPISIQTNYTHKKKTPLKILHEAEITAGVIYKQSQQLRKGESSMAGERVFLQRRILKSLL